MSYFSAEMPGVEPNMDDAGFWAACNERRLAFQACADCGVLRHPPTPMCAACHATRVTWVDAPQRAEVYTFVVVHHASHPAVTPNLPYVVAVVSFPELPGVRLVTNITEIAPEAVHIGMEVDLWWDALDDGTFLPRFRRATKEAA